MDFGVIKSISIGVNLDTGEDVRLAQVTILDEDVVTVELPFSQGHEYVPAVGDTVFFSEVDAGWLVGHYVQSAIPVDSSLGTGEKELFSVSGNNRKARLRLDSGSQIILNDGDGYAVEFGELKDGITNILNALQTHTHSAAGGATGTPLYANPLDTPTSDSIDGSKVEKVRL